MAKPSRTPVTDDRTILDVPGWSGGVAATTGYLRGRSGDENVVLTDPDRQNGPVAYETLPAGTDDCLSPSHPCKQVVLMSAAQMLKTSVMVNFLGYIADVDRGRRCGGAGAEDAKRFQRIASRRCSGIRRCSEELAAVKSRDSNNTAMPRCSPTVPGTSPSPVPSRVRPGMRPIRYLLRTS